VCVCVRACVFDHIECLSVNNKQDHLTAVCLLAMNTIRANKRVVGQQGSVSV
jgi:hypothetical protein